MSPDDLRAACLRLRGAAEDFPFPRYPDRSAFKVGGKVFAISSLRQEPLRVSLKCDPDLAVRLRAEHAAIQPGYVIGLGFSETDQGRLRAAALWQAGWQ